LQKLPYSWKQLNNGCCMTGAVCTTTSWSSSKTTRSNRIVLSTCKGKHFTKSCKN